MKQTWLTGEMFQNIFPIPRAVFDFGLGPGDLLVYVYLLYRKNSRSGKCWPSYRDIGKAVGLDRKTIRKHVCSLVDAGLVETENTTVRWGATPTTAISATRSSRSKMCWRGAARLCWRS